MGTRFSDLDPGERFTLRSDSTHEQLVKVNPVQVDELHLGQLNALSLADGSLQPVDPTDYVTPIPVAAGITS